MWIVHATSLIEYDHRNVLLFGSLFGIGALGGDAVKSFFKRRLGIATGTSWFPYDQVDYILGAIVATVLFVQLPVAVYLWAIVLWPAIHLVSTYFGYRLGLKERPL